MPVEDAKLLQRVWDMSPDMLCLASPQGHLTEVNPSFTRILGWSEEELESTPFLEFVHPDDREATIAETQRLAAGEPTIHFENRYRCKDGTWKWLAWRCEPQGDELFAVARDVTDRKRLAEEEQQRARAEATASAMERVASQQRLILNAASHELNTPLTPIVFDLATLEAYLEDQDGAQRALRSIRRNVCKLQETITRLLHVSQLATERMRIRAEPVRVRDLLDESTKGTPPAECPDELEVYGDETLLAQAVKALVQNAEQHGGGVESVGAEHDESRVVISVQDRGPGFAGDAGEDWFLPLHRGDDTQSLPGSGLGLTMVRLVATAHNGEAGVSSPGADQGTTAWLTIPRAQT